MTVKVSLLVILVGVAVAFFAIGWLGLIVAAIGVVGLLMNLL